MYLSKYAGMCKYLLIYERLFVVSKPLHTCQAKEENVLQIRGQICMYGLLFGFKQNKMFRCAVQSPFMHKVVKPI